MWKADVHPFVLARVAGNLAVPDSPNIYLPLSMALHILIEYIFFYILELCNPGSPEFSSPLAQGFDLHSGSPAARTRPARGSF